MGGVVADGSGVATGASAGAAFSGAGGADGVVAAGAVCVAAAGAAVGAGAVCNSRVAMAARSGIPCIVARMVRSRRPPGCLRVAGLGALAHIEPNASGNYAPRLPRWRQRPSLGGLARHHEALGAPKGLS